MSTPNESTDPLRPAYPDAADGGKATEGTGRKRTSQRNIATLVILAVVVLLVVFFLGREPEKASDEPAPLPTAIE